MRTEMGADGVKDIVYIEYGRGGQSEAAVNYATEKLKPLSDNNKPARCHWIGSTGAGCDEIATGVIALMERTRPAALSCSMAPVWTQSPHRADPAENKRFDASQTTRLAIVTEIRASKA